MKSKSKLKVVGAAAALAFASGSFAAEGSSNDALLQLLIKKGLLTEAEASAIRTEATASKAVTVTNAPAGNSIKLYGDFRGRFEGLYAENPAFIDRNRFRMRLRAGLVSNLGEKFEVGMRLTSGEGASGVAGGNPLSGNVTFQDNASKKLSFIDLAYGRWKEIQTPDLSAALTLGKIENPFVFTDLIFDYDYTPEGVSQTFAWNVSPKQKLSLNLGGFIVDGVGVTERDSFLLGSQIRLDSNWSKQWQTSAGIAALGITHTDELVNANAPNQNRGNSRPGPNRFGAGALSTGFAPIVADASVTRWQESIPFYPGRFPIKLGGEFLDNLSANANNQAYSINFSLGKAAKKGQWELSYRWKYLEGDAWYEELVDDDFGAFYQSAPDAGGAAGFVGGTNVRGHLIKACYAVSDSFTLGATAFFTELIKPSPANSQSAFTRLQVDALWKF